MIGKRVEKWRDERGLSQRDAAKGAGISQAQWSAIESGRVKRIGLEIARKVVAYMGGAITMEDLGARTKLPAPAPAPESRPARRSRKTETPRTGTDG